MSSKSDNSSLRYGQIAQQLEKDIVAGRIRPGERLPTVRELAREMEVSVTTISAAYRWLRQRGRIAGTVGRGTFVTGEAPRQTRKGDSKPGRGPWRRRALTACAARLRTTYPKAIDCTSGMPDPSLLPWRPLQRGWRAAIDATANADLQYGGPEPVDALARALVPRLAADGVPCREADLIIGSSAQQLMSLALERAAAVSGSGMPLVAVEEPGYPTILDTYERAGYKLVGVGVDAQGALPESLDAALKSGAAAVLFTPRAHNPTGASWSPRRMTELADILAANPGVLILEDDHFADIASTRPGSLLSDSRIEDRVIYIRSFSKSIGPDLRVAAAAARPRWRALLTEAKGFADGWTSRLSQHALARAFADPELSELLAVARDAYAERRRRAVQALQAGLGSGEKIVEGGADGVNVWLHLPTGVDSAQVIEGAAQRGVHVLPGEPFFIHPGRNDAVRLNACAVSPGKAHKAGQALAGAASASYAETSTITV